MELEFRQEQLHYMHCVVSQVQNSEQTQEIRLGDGMPDVGRVIGAWGQPVVRSKEWRSDRFGFSGGMMVWVLYSPEDEGQPQVLSSWIPFQMHWDLPDGVPEGQIQILCLTRYVDARTVSPRKIMVRAGLGALGQGFVREKTVVYQSGEQIGDIQLLENRYPVRLVKEAGEKVFHLDEELAVPDSVPVPVKIIYCTLDQKLQDHRVVSDKMVFRGEAKLHLVYESETGQLHVWDFSMPFSQYTELADTYGNDAQSSIQLAVTSMEPERMEDGKIRLKCSLLAQYLISDREMIQVVEDAYDPARELEVQMQPLALPVLLEEKRGNLYPQYSFTDGGDICVDTRFLPDFPRQYRNAETAQLYAAGTFQLLYYGADGKLHGSNAGWEETSSFSVPENAELTVIPMNTELQTAAAGGAMNVKAEMPLVYITGAEQSVPMITRIHPGSAKQPDPNRPSLIIARCDTRLWDLARNNGTTVEHIRKANHLEGECAPGQLLLIPIL